MGLVFGWLCDVWIKGSLCGCILVVNWSSVFWCMNNWLVWCWVCFGNVLVRMVWFVLFKFGGEVNSYVFFVGRVLVDWFVWILLILMYLIWNSCVFLLCNWLLRLRRRSGKWVNEIGSYVFGRFVLINLFMRFWFLSVSSLVGVVNSLIVSRWICLMRLLMVIWLLLRWNLSNLSWCELNGNVSNWNGYCCCCNCYVLMFIMNWIV